MMALLFAVAALFSQGYALPLDFTLTILTRCEPVMSADFIGCEAPAADGEMLYAGLITIDGAPALVTGP